jgi:hypothetical protein
MECNRRQHRAIEHNTTGTGEEERKMNKSGRQRAANENRGKRKIRPKMNITFIYAYLTRALSCLVLSSFLRTIPLLNLGSAKKFATLSALRIKSLVGVWGLG